MLAFQRNHKRRKAAITNSIVFALLMFSTTGASGEDSKLVLLLGQAPDGHPYSTHEYLAGLRIIRKCLDRVDGIHAEIVAADEPFRDGPERMDKADGVVLYLAEGAKWVHQDATRLAALQRLANRGGGLVGLHWGIGCRDAEYIHEYVNLLGACHGGPDRKIAVLTTTTEVAAVDHPIMTSIPAVTLEDEFYYRLKLTKSDPPVTSLLRARIDGESHMVAWAWERRDQGRSFGFTGLHFHKGWEQMAYRRLVVQGIVWTLKLPIPARGLSVEVSEDDLQLPERK
jgi:hypothetical protein